MDLSELFSESWNAVHRAELPEIVQPIAFAKAIEIFESRLNEGASGRSALQAEPVSGRLDGEYRPVELIAEGLGISVDAASELFYVDEDEIELMIPRSRLPHATAAATKQIALLTAAGRQLARYDDGWTSASVIREMCRQFNRLDTRNFSATLLEMDEEFVVRGKGQTREIRVARPGLEKARELALYLTDGGQR